MNTPRETRTVDGLPTWATDPNAAEREALANSRKRQREHQRYQPPKPPTRREWLTSVGLALLLGMVLGGIAVGNWYGPVTAFLRAMP